MIVGHYNTASGDRAFIWDATDGMRDLLEILEAEGLDLTGWTLHDATGLSDDGLRICGNGTNPDGDQEAWVVILPSAPCPADLDGDGNVSVTDLLFVLGAWGSPDADTNDDGTTNIVDLLNVLGAWGSCN